MIVTMRGGTNCAQPWNGLGHGPDGCPDVHRFPQPLHMSEGPVTLARWPCFPLFPSPYYY